MRSEDELLEIIHRRAAELTAARRRRIRLVTTLSVSVIVALAATVAIAPSDGPPTRVDAINGENASQVLPGRWVPIAYSAPIVPPEGVYLEFRDDGSLSGYDGCNSFSAKWAANADRLHVTEIESTKVGCSSDRDTRLVRILDDDPRMDAFDNVSGTLELRSESGFVAFSPEDRATPDTSGTPITTTTFVESPAPTEAPTTTTEAISECDDHFDPSGGGQVSLGLAIDRTTYQPGDVIEITVTLTNQTDRACWVATEGPGCIPVAHMNHFFAGDEAEPRYQVLLGPFRGPCGDRRTVPGDGSITATIRAPFEPPEGYFLRAGTWELIADWPYYMRGGEVVPVLHFECPEPGCRKGSFDNPPPQ